MKRIIVLETSNKQKFKKGSFTRELYHAFKEELSSIILKLFQNWRGKNASKLTPGGQHHSDTKTKQRYHIKKGKLQGNITDEYRSKNL